MKLLRIRGSLRDASHWCEWAVISAGQVLESGSGPLAQAPRGARRVQFVLPAQDVLLVRRRLPAEARRRAGTALAYAVEEQTMDDPEANLVSWLGTAGEDDVLATVDRAGLARWRDALATFGARDAEVHSEILLLPWEAGQWGVAWSGSDGFVRTGMLEGMATDGGDAQSPPLALRLLAEQALAQGTVPNAVVVHPMHDEAAPDADAWTRELGITTRIAEVWNWRLAPADAGKPIASRRQDWGSLAGLAPRLRPAAWILGVALAFHALALAVDWTRLAGEQRQLRQAMEARFRASFPDALVVVDPLLQMRRNLAQARNVAGLPDEADFLVMVRKLAAAAAGMPPGQLRVLSYDTGRMTLELAVGDEAAVQSLVAGLATTGLVLEAPASGGGDAPWTLAVRAQ